LVVATTAGFIRRPAFFNRSDQRAGRLAHAKRGSQIEGDVLDLHGEASTAYFSGVLELMGHGREMSMGMANESPSYHPERV
jgi:hypothetical protein